MWIAEDRRNQLQTSRFLLEPPSPLDPVRHAEINLRLRQLVAGRMHPIDRLKDCNTQSAARLYMYIQGTKNVHPRTSSDAISGSQIRKTLANTSPNE